MPVSITTVLLVIGVTVTFAVSAVAGVLVLVAALLWELATTYQAV